MLDANRWRDPDFSSLSFKHRALLIALECLADKAGVVDWNLDKIHAVVGDGPEITRLDIHSMGADHVVWMPDGCAVLLSQFMKSQYGTLSRKCPAHSPVWQAIKKWWGERESIHHQEPFKAFFAEKLITRHGPLIKDEDQGGEVPAWKIRALEDAELVKAVVIPEALPQCVYCAVKDMFAWRQRMVDRARIRTEGEKWTWTKEQAEHDIEQISSMLRTYTPESVEAQIRNMIRGTSLYLNPPKPFRSNLLSQNKGENDE